MYGKFFIKGIGYYIFAELLCLFLVFSMGLMNNIFFRIVSLVCCLGIMVCLVINFAINCHKQVKEAGADEGILPAVITGTAASCPYLLLYALLLASKAGQLPDTFYRIYKILNAPSINLLNLISSDVLSGSLGAVQLVLLLLVALIPMVTGCAAYILCRKGIVPEDFLFVKK